MNGKFVSVLHSLNILFQSFYSLALPVGVGALASHLLTKYASFPKWIWAILLTVGVFIGLYSMVKYILSATKNLENLEKEKERTRAEAEEKAERQARLREDLNKLENKGDNNG